MPKPWPCASGSRTSTLTRLPSCSAWTSIVSVAAFDLPCFSTTTSTSGLSHGRISIAPSNVLTATSGVPLTVKRFSSRSVNLPRSAPIISMQPGAASTTARAAAVVRNRYRPVVRERSAIVMTQASGLLDGRCAGGVSCVDELSGDIGLNDGELRIEDDEIRNRAWGKDSVTDQAELAGRRGRANCRRVHQRQPDLPNQHLKGPIHRQDAAGNRPVGPQRGSCAGGNRLAAEHRGGADGQPGGGRRIGNRHHT